MQAAQYVYDLSSGIAILTATLDNPTPATSDQFGISVSVSADTVLVGAPLDDSAATNAGSAYVYDISTGTANLTATLTNPTMANSDRFGNSVSISGSTLVVGAKLDDTRAIDAGSAYVYDMSNGTPLLTATLNNPTVAPGGDQFGFSVSASGDTVVVGSP